MKKFFKIVLIFILVIFGMALFGSMIDDPVKEGQSKKTAVTQSSETASETPPYVISQLSFQDVDNNALVELQCLKPGTKSGFNWVIKSLDGKNPPKAQNLYYNLQTKDGTLLSKDWREMNIHNNNVRVPAGDAFMVTTFQTKEMLAANYSKFVFVIGNNINDARHASSAFFFNVNEIIKVSAVEMSENPCSSLD